MEIKPFQGSLLQSSLVDDIPQFLYELRNDFSNDLEEKYYVRCEKPSYFIYQVLKNGHSHHGLVVHNSPEDVLNDKIFKHELILPNKFDKIKNLIRSTGYMIKPIMMFHKPIDELNKILDDQINTLPLTISVKLDEEIHNIYTVSEEDIVGRITEIFENKIPEAFIADGHHRYESIIQLMKEGSTLSPPRTIHMVVAYFASDMLNVEPFDRLIQLPKDINLSALKTMFESIGKLKKVKELFRIEKKYNFFVVFGTKQYRVKLKKSIIKKYKVNNDSALTVQILESELSILFSEWSNEKLQMEYFTGKPDKKARAEIKGSTKMMIHLPPIRLKDIMKISRQGRTLPAKSTWFTPKIRSGLVIGKI